MTFIAVRHIGLLGMADHTSGKLQVSRAASTAYRDSFLILRKRVLVLEFEVIRGSAYAMYLDHSKLTIFF